MDELIKRQSAIDFLEMEVELLRRALDDFYLTGIERIQYECGLSLIMLFITEIKELPSAEPDLEGVYASGYTDAEADFHKIIIRCKDCRKRNPSGYCTEFQRNIHGIATAWYQPEDNDFCSKAERRTDE